MPRANRDKQPNLDSSRTVQQTPRDKREHKNTSLTDSHNSKRRESKSELSEVYSAVIYQESSEEIVRNASFPALDDIRPGHPSLPVSTALFGKIKKKKEEKQLSHSVRTESRDNSVYSTLGKGSSSFIHDRRGGPLAVHSQDRQTSDDPSVKARQSDDSLDSDMKLIMTSDVNSAKQDSDLSQPGIAETVEEEDTSDPSWLADFPTGLMAEEEIDEDELYFKVSELPEDVSVSGSFIEEIEDDEDEATLGRASSYLNVSIKDAQEEGQEDYPCESDEKQSTSSQESHPLDGGPSYGFNTIFRRKGPRWTGSGQLPTYKKPPLLQVCAHTFSKYLKENIGCTLVECITQIAIMRPYDPVGYLANWLKELPKVEEEKKKFNFLRESIISSLSKSELGDMEYEETEEQPPSPPPPPPPLVETKKTPREAKYNLRDAEDTESFLDLMEKAGVSVRPLEDVGEQTFMEEGEILGLLEGEMGEEGMGEDRAGREHEEMPLEEIEETVA